MAEHNLEWDSLLMPCSSKGNSAQAILLDEMVFSDAQCDDELAYSHPFGELWTGGAGSTEQLQEGQGASSPHACSSAALGHPTLAAGLAGSSPCSPNHKPAAKQVEVPPPVAEVSRACSLVRPYNEAVRCAPSSNTTCPTAEPVPDSPRQYVHPPVASPRTYWGPVTTGGQSVQLGNGCLAANAAGPGLSAQAPLMLPSMPSGPYLYKVPDSTDRQLQSIMRQLEMSSSSTLADPEMFTLSRHGSMLTTPATSEHSSTDTHFLSGMFLVCAAPKPSPCPVLNSLSATAAATPSSFNRAASVSGPMASLAQQHSLEHQLSLPVPQQLQPPVPAAPAAGTALRRGAVTLPVPPPAAPVPAVGAMAIRAGMVDVPPQSTDIKKRAAGIEGLDMAAAKRKPGRQPAGVPPSLAAPQAPGSTAVAPRPRKTPKRHSCHNCGVHSTPQWRCGPDGPRTLCNACGVRYKKGLPLRSYPYKDAQGLAARTPAVVTQVELTPSAAQPASPGVAQAAAPLMPCAAAQARPAHAAPELQQQAVPSQQLQLMLPPQQPQLALRGQSGVTCPTIFAVGSSLPATGYCF